MPFSTPAGTMMPYAGPLSRQALTALATIGWIPCDGSPLPIAQFTELFQTIGTNYGGDGTTSFNVPDLRGRFLRATDRGAGVDPNASTRTAPQSGGNKGDLVGSAQGDATALPVNPFTTTSSGNHQHLAPYQPEVDHQAAAGASGPAAADRMAWRPNSSNTGEAGAHTHTIVAGGDGETRPVNIYLFWLIKFNSSL